MHDRAFVQMLHQAYADKTEAFFAGLKRAPGDPCNVRIRSFGSTRTFIASGHDWLNRATLVGDEAPEQIDEIIAYFSREGKRCHAEWNPGNCYRPDAWNDELGRQILDRGFRPGGFRCVWIVETTDCLFGESPPIVLRHFGPGEKEEFLAILGRMEDQTPERAAQSRLNVLYGEGDERWHHYVGYVDDVPCCNATLFVNGTVACLDWGHTLEEYRGLGCHRSLIRRRLRDAREAGCSVVFAVSDIGIPSARNLQREGFQLAYNYVMLARDPTPPARNVPP